MNIIMWIIQKLFWSEESKAGNHAVSDDVIGVTGVAFAGETAIPLSFDEEYKGKIVAHTDEVLKKIKRDSLLLETFTPLKNRLRDLEWNNLIVTLY